MTDIQNADIRIVMRPPSELKPAKTNARTHSQKQIAQLAASNRPFGFTNPVLTDGSGRIVAGHGRGEAAKGVGLSSVPDPAPSHPSRDDAPRHCPGLHRSG